MISPIWLLGLLAASIPLIIHLFHRSRASRLLFSTLRFLRIAVERTRRRRRIENLFLLVLRSVLLALLAIGLAGPVIYGKGAASVAVILDNSGSMDCRYEGESRMDHAREIAREIVTKRQGGRAGALDEYRVILTNGPDAMKDEPFTSDLGSLGAMLDAVRPIGARADMPAAVTVATENLREANNANRQIVILGDLQEISWEGASEGVIDEDTNVVVADLGREEFRNLAVTEVAAIGGATIAGSPVVMAATIYNASKETIANRSVTLVAEGGQTIRKTVSVEPEKSATVIFNPVWDVPGTYAGRIVVDKTGDSMALDNERFFKVDIKERIHALAVKGEDDAGYLDDAYFLVRALDPRRVLGGSARSVIDVKVLTVAQFDRKALGEARVVFVLNVASMDGSQVKVLRRLVEAGGAVVFFPGDNLKASAWMTCFGESFKGGGHAASLVPEIEGQPRKVGAGRFIAIRTADLEHSPLSVLSGMPRRFFEAVHAYEYLPVAAGAEAQSRVLLALEGDTPFLLERRIGLGRVFFFTVTANRAWSNFPLTTAYPVVLSELVFSVAADEVRLTSHVVGDRVEIVFPNQAAATFDVHLTDPSGDTVSLDVERRDEDAVAAYDGTWTPGVYAWRTTGDLEREGSFVVNIDPEEPLLARTGRSDIVNVLKGHGINWTEGVKDTQRVARSLREDRPLTEWFMFGVLALVVFEVWLANRTRRRSDDQEQAGSAAERRAA